MIPNKFFIALFAAIVCLCARARTVPTSQPFSLSTGEALEVVASKAVFTSSGSISPGIKEPIDALAITGTIVQPNASSFVRIILEDTEGHEYIVLETCRMYNDADTLNLHEYCEETMSLAGITPAKVKVFLSNATVEIQSFKAVPRNHRSSLKGAEKAEFRKVQCQITANRINEYNRANGKLWRAAVTELTTLPWESRKTVLGFDDESKISGYEYYNSGIFEMGEPSVIQQNLIASNPSLYIDNFDWRDRHGVNWMTPVKNQTSESGSCWAFSAVGVTEALVNLYYNSRIDYDLSEQEVLSCSDCGDDSGGYATRALYWICNHGVSEEASFPYVHCKVPCSNKGDYSEIVSLNQRHSVGNWYNNPDNVKRALIEYGPLLSGTKYETSRVHCHFMVLVGYKTIHAGDTIYVYENYNQHQSKVVIQENDSRIGMTYWIFKNSYGPNIHSNGYTHVLFYDPQNCFVQPYYATTPVSTLLLTDDDIAITDNDGDGYYYWGISPKPAHCPDWVPDEPDGDDSDYAMGPMDQYGFLYDLSSHVGDIVSITSDTIWSQKRYIYNNIVVPVGVTLTITQEVVFYSGSKISMQGGTLVVDGGQLQSATIEFDDSLSSQVIVKNNGSINLASGKSYDLPAGSTMEITSGTIN